jgi:hypothetical protein
MPGLHMQIKWKTNDIPWSQELYPPFILCELSLTTTMAKHWSTQPQSIPSIGHSFPSSTWPHTGRHQIYILSYQHPKTNTTWSFSCKNESYNILYVGSNCMLLLANCIWCRNKIVWSDCVLLLAMISDEGVTIKKILLLPSCLKHYSFSDGKCIWIFLLLVLIMI